MFGFRKLGQKVRDLFGKKVDEGKIEELEQLFYEADLGIETSQTLTDRVRSLYRKSPEITVDQVQEALKKELASLLPTPNLALSGKPHVILIVGTNGNGKTTSAAKLAYSYQQQGKKVILAAADTFRAAGIEQLEMWAQRNGLDLVKGRHGADSAAIVYDAIEAGKTRGADVVIVDTAGRLHTKHDLMQELEKIQRVSNKALPGAPHETLLVLDATIGQNGIEQARIFHQYTPLTGLILTKLDGTAKGGAVIAIQKKLDIPIYFIGVGERITDLRRFDPAAFVEDLF